MAGVGLMCCSKTAHTKYLTTNLIGDDNSFTKQRIVKSVRAETRTMRVLANAETLVK